MSGIDLFKYDDHDVRALVIDGEPWFVLRDVCSVLAIAQPIRVAEALDDDEVTTTHVTDSLGRQQLTYIVSESGLYSLILRSRKPQAKAFKRWITHEVLPAIRKTGSYGTSPALSGPELMAAALIEAQATLAAKDEKIAELEPKAEYVDVYVADSDLRLMRNVAKSLDVKEDDLRKALIDAGWIYAEHTTRWSERDQCKKKMTRYSAYSDKTRYFRPVPAHDAPRFKGEVMHTLKVTPDGAAAIARFVARRNVIPIDRSATA